MGETKKAYRVLSYWMVGGAMLSYFVLKITKALGRTYNIYLLQKYKMFFPFLTLTLFTYHGFKLKTYKLKKVAK
jgi:hypothetical protein